MNVQRRLGLVVTSRQLLVAQVAVTLSSGVTEHALGGWEEYRVCLGDVHDGLARRLNGARDLNETSGARIVDLLDGDGRPVVAVELEFSEADVRVLRVAIDRLRGILARTGEFDGALDDDLDDLALLLA